jgi:hypothetical protein
MLRDLLRCIDLCVRDARIPFQSISTFRFSRLRPSPGGMPDEPDPLANLNIAFVVFEKGVEFCVLSSRETAPVVFIHEGRVEPTTPDACDFH